MSALVIAFLIGALAGANGVGLLALVLHQRLAETLRLEQAARLAASRRKAYSQGYETRAALEFAAREDGQ